MSEYEEFVIENGALVKYRRKHRHVVIPDGVTSIGNRAFCFYDNLKSITIPNSVTSIGSNAFSGCSKLESIIIPNGVTSIEGCAFDGCSKLESIVIPDSVTSIGKSAFEACSGLTSVTIPDSVTSIGANAFSFCSNLKSITIPDCVTNIGCGAFMGCENLESIVLEGNTRYKFQSYCLIDTTDNSVIWGCQKSVIPSSVTSVGNSAFKCCSNLKSIVLPTSVTSIGSHAFANCSSLEEINLDKVSFIEEKAFYECTKLRAIVLNVAEISSYAFSSCEELSSVTLHNTKRICSDAFSMCSQLRKIDLPTGLVEIGKCAFAECGLKEVVVPKTVLKTANESFSGCATITIYDTIDPDAKPADEHLDDVDGKPNSNVGFIGIGRGYPPWQYAANHSWVDHEIIVRSAENDEIKYKVWMGSDPSQRRYYCTLTSSWGKNATFNFAALDAAFPKIKGINHKIKVAMNRIRYPKGLSDEKKDFYITYLVRFAKDVVTACIDSDDMETLLYCEPFGIIKMNNVDYLLEYATKAKAIQFFAYLMEYKANHWGFSTIKRRFF